MKRSMFFVLVIACCLLAAVLSGCAVVKEAAKGFAGVSTQVLEDKRKDAIKETFAIDYDDCYAKVKDILKEKIKVKENETEVESSSYIYAENAEKKMLAVYLSETDTTPVGIFFTPEGKGSTIVEVSSPSTYAKENIAKRISTAINASLKPGEDKVSDVKKEISNQ